MGPDHRAAQGRSVRALIDSGAGVVSGRELREASLAGLLSTVYCAEDPLIGVLEAMRLDASMIASAAEAGIYAPAPADLASAGHRLARMAEVALELHERLEAARRAG